MALAGADTRVGQLSRVELGQLVSFSGLLPPPGERGDGAA